MVMSSVSTSDPWEVSHSFLALEKIEGEELLQTIQKIHLLRILSLHEDLIKVAAQNELRESLTTSAYECRRGSYQLPRRRVTCREWCAYYVVEWVSEWVVARMSDSLLLSLKTGSARPESPAPAGPVPRPEGACRRPHPHHRRRRRHHPDFGHVAASFFASRAIRRWVVYGGHVVRRSPRLTTRSAGSRPAGTPECQCWTRNRRPHRRTPKYARATR